jgi:hypothetical protein
MELERIYSLASLKDPSYASSILSEGNRRNDPLISLIAHLLDLYSSKLSVNSVDSNMVKEDYRTSSTYSRILTQYKQLIDSLSEEQIQYLITLTEGLNYRYKLCPPKLKDISTNILKLCNYFCITKTNFMDQLHYHAVTHPSINKELRYDLMLGTHLPISDFLGNSKQHGVLKRLRIPTSQLLTLEDQGSVGNVDYLYLDYINRHTAMRFTHRKTIEEAYYKAFTLFSNLKHLKILNFQYDNIPLPSLESLELDVTFDPRCDIQSDKLINYVNRFINVKKLIISNKINVRSNINGELYLEPGDIKLLWMLEKSKIDNLYVKVKSRQNTILVNSTPGTDYCSSIFNKIKELDS